MRKTRNGIKNASQNNGLRVKLWMWLAALIACFAFGSSKAQAQWNIVKTALSSSRTTTRMARMARMAQRRRIYQPAQTFSMSAYSVHGLHNSYHFTPTEKPLSVHLPMRQSIVGGFIPNAHEKTRLNPAIHEKEVAAIREAARKSVQLKEIKTDLHTHPAPHNNETLKRLHIDQNATELTRLPWNTHLGQTAEPDAQFFTGEMQQHPQTDTDNKEKITEACSSIGEAVMDEVKDNAINQHIRNFHSFLKLIEKIKRNSHRINRFHMDFVITAYLMLLDDYEEYFELPAA